MLFIRDYYLSYMLGYFIRNFGCLRFVVSRYDIVYRFICDISNLYVGECQTFIYLRLYYSGRIFDILRYRSLGDIFDDKHRILRICIEINSNLNRLKYIREKYEREKSEIEQSIFALRL